LKQLTLFTPASEQKKIIDQLQNVDLPALEKDLEVTKKRLAVTPEQPALPDSPEMRVAAAVIQGEMKFSTLHCPALSIFASPHDLGPMAASLKPEQRAAMEAMDADTTGPQVKAFQLGNPNAKVVVLAHASHAVFASNESDVLREIDSFAATLKE
jgi:non-heme chloroperoxidase